MGHHIRLAAFLLTSTLLLGTPAVTLGKGGGGGHGGGRGHSGGGHSCSGGGHGGGGGHSVGGGTSGGHWSGWSGSSGNGLASGPHGYAAGAGYGWHFSNYGYGFNPIPVPGIGISVGNRPSGTSPDAAASSPASPPSLGPLSGRDLSAGVRELIDQGERAFKARNYESAVENWRRAAMDGCQNGLLLMMLGQALFATGEYDEAAFATQSAMQQLPMKQWGIVVVHYMDLYGTAQDFVDQLRALEKAQQAKPHDPALQFLTGFQLGYLGFTDQAVEQLDETLLLVPHDEMTDLLRNQIMIDHAKSLAAHPAHGSPPVHGFAPTLH